MEQHIQQESQKSDLTSMSLLLDQAFMRYKAIFKYLVPVSTAIFAISIGQAFVDHVYNPNIQPVANMLASVVLGIASYFTMFFAYSMGIQAMAKRDMSQEISQREMYSAAVRTIIPYSWVAILLFFAIMGGLLLFIVPGIVVALLVSFSYYALFADGKRGIEALKTSWRAVRGRWWKTFWRLLLFGGIVVLLYFFVGVIFNIGGLSVAPAEDYANIPVGLVVMQIINSFFFVPFGISFMYSVYRALSSTCVPVTEEDDAVIASKIKWLFISGVVFITALIAVTGIVYVKYADKVVMPWNSPAAVWLWKTCPGNGCGY